ncbi:MAG: sugar phosphate isomerase/epimerase [Gammaproteobacteria bacterium]|nr:sugar phosphate isomerase/epimerase [Gammaproteobacteria bacterium]
MAWLLRYASHLGFRSLDAPLFLASVGSSDPVAHVNFAHELGFAGVQDALALQRKSVDSERIGRALLDCAMEPGCILYAPMSMATAPLWGTSAIEARHVRRRQLDAAILCAKGVGARRIAVLSGADPKLPKMLQLAFMINNLREAAESAERNDVVLCLEAVNSQALPNMLLQHVMEAYLVVRAVESPYVRLVFDTAHVQIMDGDVLTNLDRVWDAVEVVQVANVPGRVEPQAGELAMKPFLQSLVDRRYSGLVELEHVWSVPGRESEQRGIAYLTELERQLRPAPLSGPP